MSSAPRSAHLARVVERRDVGGAMTLLALAVPDELRASFVRAGQYARVRYRDEDGYFVLGNREGRAPWEIIMRNGGGVADLLVDAPLGTEVTVSPALGSGFPVESARGEEVLVVVTAAAIAAVRSVVARRIEEGDAHLTRVLVGARTADSIALQNEIAVMEAAGVRFRTVLSRATEGNPTYVQHVLERDWCETAWVFVAGASAMIADVKAAAVALGARPDRIISNV